MATKLRIANEHGEYWDFTQWYCLHCAERTVWACTQSPILPGWEGLHLCTACGFQWHLRTHPLHVEHEGSHVVAVRLASLRIATGTSNQPTPHVVT